MLKSLFPKKKKVNITIVNFRLKMKLNSRKKQLSSLKNPFSI